MNLDLPEISFFFDDYRSSLDQSLSDTASTGLGERLNGHIGEGQRVNFNTNGEQANRSVTPSRRPFSFRPDRSFSVWSSNLKPAGGIEHNQTE